MSLVRIVESITFHREGHKLATHQIPYEWLTLSTPLIKHPYTLTHTPVDH